MATFLATFSFLVLIALVGYLVWKNDWLFGQLSKAQRETADAKVQAAQRESRYREAAARREAELEKFQEVRAIEMAVYEEKTRQLAAQAEESRRIAASAQKQLPSSNGQGFWGKVGSTIDDIFS